LGDLLNKLTKAIQPNIDIAEITETVLAAVKEEYGKPTIVELRHDPLRIERIEGAHKTFPTLLRAMSSRQSDGYHPNILLVGPTGSGKTHAVREAAKHLGLQFFTNGAISMDYQLIGFRDASGHYHETPFRKAFDKPAVYLFDEIDSSDNSPLLALAGALANGHFAFPDTEVCRHSDSVIIAAGNTWGHGATADFVGRQKLDAAIRSRFPVRIHWDYDETLEAQICGNAEWASQVQAIRAKARKAGLKIVIDPRITIAGAALIAAGCSLQEAAELTYLADLTPDQRKMLEG
jgi:cobaltochelatase CobS